MDLGRFDKQMSPFEMAALKRRSSMDDKTTKRPCMFGAKLTNILLVSISAHLLIAFSRKDAAEQYSMVLAAIQSK